MVANPEYIPNRGDVVWLTFDRAQGHEQRGRRPACVLTPQGYNEITGMAIVCPITSKRKGYPFEVALSLPQEESAVLVDQLRAIDWRMRSAQYIGRTPLRAANEVDALVRTLLKL